MPEFVHPSVSSEIVDEDVSFITAQGLTNLFAAFKSLKGPDREIIYVTTPTEYTFYYGEPDISQYGQTPNNVTAWLGTAGAAYCLRVTPDDAHYSNLLFSMRIRYDGTKMSMYPVAYSLPNVTERSVIETAVDDRIGADVPDADAEVKDFPLFSVTPLGRGANYNNIQIRFSRETSFDNTFDSVIYEFQVLEKRGEAVVEAEPPFYVSLDPTERTISRASMYLSDVVNTHSQYVRTVVHDEGIEALNSYVNDITDIDLDTPVDFREIDVTTTMDDIDDLGLADILHADPYNADDSHSGLVTADFTDAAALATATTGQTDFTARNALDSGSDGSNPASGSNSEEALLVEAYKGLTDPNITDKRAVDFDVVLDGNLPITVKNAAADLAQNIRRDFMFFADCNFAADPDAAIAFRDGFSVDSHNVSIWSQDFLVFDNYTGKNIRVTAPYLLASKIPTNDDQFGIFKNFVGPRRGAVSGHIPGSFSWFPTEAEKSALYLRQINYVERNPTQTYMGSQLTSLNRNTPMSNVHVARTVFRMIRTSERIADNYRFENFSNETFDGLRNDLQNAMNIYQHNGVVSEVRVNIHSTAYERSQKRLRVTMEAFFVDIIERIFISLSVRRS